MKEDIKNLNRGDNSTSPLIGKTTIELRDSKTGELTYQKEDYNLVTNYFQGPFDLELCGTFTSQPNDMPSQIKGVQLLNHQEDEHRENVCMEVSGSAVTGFGTLVVNSSQANPKWMSYNLVESGQTQNGYRWVWDANVNQCNGPISCVSLITKDLNNTFYGSTNRVVNSITLSHLRTVAQSMPLYLGKWIDDGGNQNNSHFQTGMFSNIVHIDWENDIMYDIERNYDDSRKIVIKRYNLNRKKINFIFKLKPTLIDEREITFSESLNYDHEQNSTSTYARPFSVKIEGNYMYLVKGGSVAYQSSTNLLRIIKINLTDYTFTDQVRTLTQTFVDTTLPMQSGLSKSRNFHFIKDYYPIVDGHVYLNGVGSTNQVYKVNLSDVSDIEVITSDFAIQSATTNDPSHTLVTHQNIFFGHRRSSGTNGYNTMVTLSLSNKSFSNSNFYNSLWQPQYTSTGKYANAVSAGSVLYGKDIVFSDMYDGVLTVVRYTPTYSSGGSLYSGMVYMEQYMCSDAMVTINNVSPVTKTSDKTMRVIYELSESTS